MIEVCAGLIIGLLIGAGWRWFGDPVPNPPTLVRALLVVAMTVGYAFADSFLAKREAMTKHLCGGLTGTSCGGHQQR